MHFFGAILGFASLASATTVKWALAYSDPNYPVNTFACYNTQTGVLAGHSNWNSAGNLPKYYGASSAAVIDNGVCGTCQAITYNGKTIYVAVVDHAGEGFLVSHDAMAELGGIEAGSIDAEIVQVETYKCGF